MNATGALHGGKNSKHNHTLPRLREFRSRYKSLAMPAVLSWQIASLATTGNTTERKRTREWDDGAILCRKPQCTWVSSEVTLTNLLLY